MGRTAPLRPHARWAEPMASWAGLALDPPSGEDLARYEGFFQQLDTHGTGMINSTQAQPLFDKAGLEPSVLAQIWAFADQDQDNLLSQQEFTVAIHLAMHAVHTGYLPPLERSRPDEPSHSLSEADVARYDGYFRALEPRGGTHVDRGQAKPLFDRAGLGADALTQARHFLRCRPTAPLPALSHTHSANAPRARQLWELADVDRDGLLSLPEFRAAIHLATLAHGGAPLPQQLPTALARSAGILAASSGAPVSSGSISEAEMQRYRSIYDDNTPPGAPGMSGATAQQARHTDCP